MKKISAIIIAKNEADMIADCIRSVQFCDEVLVIDSESTDTTTAIAKKEGARVVVKKFTSYAHQRNVGMREARGEWLLYIDADERVSKKLKQEIGAIISGDSGDTDHAAYKIPRENYYLGNHQWPHIEYLERLFVKEHLKKWEGTVHEHAVYDGSLGKLSGRLIHYTHRDLASMTEKTIAWSAIESQLLVDAHHPPMNVRRFVQIMVIKFFHSYITQSGWRAGVVGLIESMYQAYSYFIIYARLWEEQQK